MPVSPCETAAQVLRRQLIPLQGALLPRLMVVINLDFSGMTGARPEQCCSRHCTWNAKLGPSCWPPKQFQRTQAAVVKG